MGKIRLKDLARTMGVPEQDLMFKMKSIGVRLEGQDPAIDSDIIQAILQGKRLPQPREVILRDDSSDAPKVAARPRPARPPAQPIRPPRGRAMIHRVEDRIREIPVKEKPEAAEPEKPVAAEPAPTPQPKAPEKPVVKAEPKAEPKRAQPVSAPRHFAKERSPGGRLRYFVRTLRFWLGSAKTVSSNASCRCELR
ncbi:MAG: hypothetical protein AAF560_11405, partial [Acidobacteriota bacterium]